MLLRYVNNFALLHIIFCYIISILSQVVVMFFSCVTYIYVSCSKQSSGDEAMACLKQGTILQYYPELIGVLNLFQTKHSLISTPMVTHFLMQKPEPDSKVHGANMGPTWVLSAPDRPHVGPMSLAIRGAYDLRQTMHWKLYRHNCCVVFGCGLVQVTLTSTHQGYRQISHIRCTENQTLNVSCLVLQLSFTQSIKVRY